MILQDLCETYTGKCMELEIFNDKTNATARMQNWSNQLWVQGTLIYTNNGKIT